MTDERRRVLIVEDNLSNIKLLEAKLQNQGLLVDIAYDGYEAIQKVSEQDFAVVLLDVMLPGIDGFEVCRRIKQLDKVSAVPIIMMTAIDTNAAKSMSYDAGADAFFVKPVEDEYLFEKVHSLRQRQAA